MNYLDIAIIVFLSIGLIRGFFRGIISEIASILGIVAGFWAAHRYYEGLAFQIAEWLSDKESIWVQNPAYVKILAFLVIFFAIVLLISFIGWGIKYIAKMTRLSWLDRFIGGLFGLVKGALISTVIIMILTLFLPKGESPILKESLLAPYVSVVTEQAIKAVPEDWRTEFMDKLEVLKDQWKDYNNE